MSLAEIAQTPRPWVAAPRMFVVVLRLDLEYLGVG
jgi:hypothetical protein